MPRRDGLKSMRKSCMPAAAAAKAAAVPGATAAPEHLPAHTQGLPAMMGLTTVCWGAGSRPQLLAEAFVRATDTDRPRLGAPSPFAAARAARYSTTSAAMPRPAAGGAIALEWTGQHQPCLHLQVPGG